MIIQAVGDPQLHGPIEKPHDLWVETDIRKELETWAVRAVFDDADDLLHRNYGVLMEFGEPAAHLFQGGESEFFSDPVPSLIGDGFGGQSTSQPIRRR